MEKWKEIRNEYVSNKKLRKELEKKLKRYNKQHKCETSIDYFEDRELKNFQQFDVYGWYKCPKCKEYSQIIINSKPTNIIDIKVKCPKCGAEWGESSRPVPPDILEKYFQSEQ